MRDAADEWIATHYLYKPKGSSKAIVKTRKPGGKKHWAKVTKEYLEWRKTDAYRRWFGLQFAKQNGLCYYCDCDLKSVKTQVEHIMPRSRGGTNKPSNLVLSCWKCNKDKNTTILPRKKVAQLRSKHISKKHAHDKEIELAIELRERFRQE